MIAWLLHPAMVDEDEGEEEVVLVVVVVPAEV